MNSSRVKKLWRGVFCVLTVWATLIIAREARAQETEDAPTSTLAGIKLPAGAVRIGAKSVPDEISQALDTMIKAGGDKVKRGRTEVLAWAGGDYKLSKVPQIKKALGTRLQAAGWQYEEGEKIPEAEGFTMVSALKMEPTRKALIGFWAPTAEGLILGWTEMLPANPNATKPEPAETDTDEPKSAEPKSAEPKTAEPAGAPDNDAPTTTETAPTTSSAPAASMAPADALVIDLPDTQRVVNVMKTTMPKLPTFPKLQPVPGKVRGYVKDTAGKPLVGARIGVRSTAVGGAETSGSGKTDEKGYYEILVPWGAAGFYNAGYTIDYGEGRAALGLHPADGEADEFASPQGHVENWVQLPYGIADRDDVSDQPQYLNNYYGGAVIFDFHDENRGYGDGLAFGTVVEITLTPQGPLVDGSKGRPIVLHKTIKEGAQSLVYVNNIPIGSYRLTANIGGSAAKPVGLKEIGPNSSQNFGLDPKEAKGQGTLLFRPYGAKADMVTAAHGNWAEIEIAVSR